MSRSRPLLPLLILSVLASVAQAKGPVYTDPKKTDVDFAIQGEYAGELETNEGPRKFGVQVIALGEGKFRAVPYRGGLPGAGGHKSDIPDVEGRTAGGRVIFTGENATATLADGALTIVNLNDEELGKLKRIHRKSPTLGKKAPKDAIVLFDGTSPDHFEKGRMTDDGLLMVGVTSKQRFQSHQVHIEFRLPYQPQDRDQARGNSGIYLQGRYEVQMLDSFGLEGTHHECGGLVDNRDTDLNMCLPPLSWQTYDILFTAAKYDDAGKVLEPPRITVHHNGVVIHRDVKLMPRSTRGSSLNAGKEPGPVYLQDHGNPVVYRNIWVVNKN